MSWILPLRLDADHMAAREGRHASAVKVDQSGREEIETSCCCLPVLKLSSFLFFFLSPKGTHVRAKICSVHVKCFVFRCQNNRINELSSSDSLFLLPVLHHNISRDLSTRTCAALQRPPSTASSTSLHRHEKKPDYFHHFVIVCVEFYHKGNVKIAAFN